MMKRDLIEITTAVMGGMSIGAAAMYLFDPDKGMSRRKMMRDEAQHMADQASCAMHQAGATLRAGKAQLQERAKRWTPASMADDSCPAMHAARVAAPVVGALALGAGLMFLLDPVSGGQRRTRMRQKAGQYTHDAGGAISSAAHGVSSRARDMYQGAKEKLGRHEHNGGHRPGNEADMRQESSQHA